MPRWDEFEAGLAAADGEFARAGMPAERDRRLRRQLGVREAARVPAARRRTRLVLAAAAATIGLVVGGVLVMRGRGERPPASVGGWEVADASPDLRAATDPTGLVAIESGVGTLRDARWGADLEVTPAVQLRRESAGIRVVRGTVKVRVSPRPAGAPPTQVLVSHGRIVVTGTRFTIVQREDGGKVELEEGGIRFVRLGGETVDLRPGQALVWPAPPAHAAATSLPATAPASAPEPPLAAGPERPTARRADSAPLRPEDLPQFLERMAALRSRGQYQVAVAELQRRLPTAQGRATRERLSFELGSILSYQLNDRARACAHWRRHLRSFRPTRYATEVSQARQRAGCAEAR